MDKFLPNIYWEKWLDTFGKNADSVKWPTWDQTPSDEDIEDSTSLKDEYFDGDDNELEMPPSKDEMFRGLVTPQGILPLTEVTHFSKVFNLWVGHTNFSITEEIQDAISNTDGVEIWTQFSPYRFRIAIARLFRSDQVKALVLENVRRLNNGDENPFHSLMG